MNQQFYSTRDAAQLLDISCSALSRALWERRFQVPERTPAGHYLWTQADLEHASWVLNHRSLNVMGRAENASIR